MFTKRCHKLHLPTLFTNLLTHGAWCQAVLINKTSPEEDMVLIEVLRVEKGYGTKREMNEFTRSGTFCKSESTAAESVTSTT